MSCSCSRYDFTLKQGADFNLTVTWKNPDGTPVNLTGRTAKLELRVQPGSDVLLTLTEADGLTLGGVLGTTAILITAAQGLALEVEPIQYDLLIINGAAIDRILEGTINVRPGITVV